MIALTVLYDVPLFVLIGLFSAWELAAHFHRNHRFHTLSYLIWYAQYKYPKLRVVTSLVLVVLFIHLVLRWL